MNPKKIMWRYLLLVIFILLVGCAGDMDGIAIDSQGAQDSELNTTQEIPTDRATPSRSVPEADALPELPNLGPAPELTNEVWLNTDRPLRLADLRGQVVLIEMWTFG